MRSLQDYIDIYAGIANKLNIQGDSVEILKQFLAHASYISEVENISYAQEASLEKSNLPNSKIQHCMNEMYSVFRGTCPRVVLNIKPLKFFDFKRYDMIVSSNTFKIYYLGYKKKQTDPDFTYAPVTLSPGEEIYQIIGLMSKEVVESDWILNHNNTYYVTCLESDLSDDVRITISDEEKKRTRIFSDHILNESVFDLTIPDFGSRLYLPGLPSSTKIKAEYFKFSTLDSFNESELKRISLKGAELIDITENQNQIAPGVLVYPETARDTLQTIHYKALKERYTNTIIRSNTDIGAVLEEMYPEKVVTGGTSYEFLSGTGRNILNIYYVPRSIDMPLTNTEIETFIDKRKAYYITDSIYVKKGEQIKAVFNIDMTLFQNKSVDSEVKDILQSYQGKFGIVLSKEKEEIRSLLSKISNVRMVTALEVVYFRDNGQVISEDELDPTKAYYMISYLINSEVQ